MIKDKESNIRLKKATIQRLNAYKATRPLGMTHDEAINELLDKDKKDVATRKDI